VTGKFLRLVSVIVILMLATVLVSGCGTQNNLLGTWEGEDGEVLEFFKDGTLIITDKFISASGNYSIIEKNRVRIELDGLWGIAGAQVINYEISGNQLYFEGTTYTKTR